MTAVGDRPWTARTEGVTVRVRVTPKSSRDGVDGIEATAQGAALKVRVRAVPDKGAANAAVAETLADWLGVPKGSITLLSGATGRVKSLSIEGEPATLGARIEARLDKRD